MTKAMWVLCQSPVFAQKVQAVASSDLHPIGH